VRRLLFALDFRKKSAAPRSKNQLESLPLWFNRHVPLRAGLSIWGVKNSRLLAARGTHWQAKSVSNRLALA
jgi:hypothetical protein